MIGDRLTGEAVQLRDAEWLRAAYAEASGEAIAHTLDCNVKTVYRFLRKHGIPLVDGGERTATRHRGEREAKRATILYALRGWSEEHDGESPSMAMWDAECTPSTKSITRLFGTWSNALQAAGLAVRQPMPTTASPAGAKPGSNRQMVTGLGLDDRLPGTVKHFGS